MPAIVLIRPKSIEASENGGRAEVVPVSAPVSQASKRARITSRVDEAGEKVSLDAASVVVSGGRGMAVIGAVGLPRSLSLIRWAFGAVGLIDAAGA